MECEKVKQKQILEKRTFANRFWLETGLNASTMRCFAVALLLGRVAGDALEVTSDNWEETFGKNINMNQVS